MAESIRNRWLFNLLVVGLIGLIVLKVAVPIYLDKREELVGERDGALKSVSVEKETLKRELILRQFMKEHGESMKSDGETVQNQLLHLMHDWETETGISGVSFQQLTPLGDHGFTRLIFQISASGPMRSMSGLIYRIETSPIPLRIDNMRLTPKADSGDPLQIQLTFSALCKGAPARTIPQPAAGGELAGGS